MNRYIALLLCCCVALAGCQVTPDVVTPNVISYDGTGRTSGVISTHDDGFVVTPHFRARYNALIKEYGKFFKPALKKDAGMEALYDATWLIDREHMVKMLQMNTWYKSGRRGT